VEQYKGMCVKYYQLSGWGSQEESKKTIDYTGNDPQIMQKRNMLRPYVTRLGNFKEQGSMI